MGCCLGSENSESPAEGNPLHISAPQSNFRQGRNAEHFGKHKTAKKILQYVCTSLYLWKPSGWGLIFSFFLALICVFQLVYDLFVVCGCPEFDCGFIEKQLEKQLEKHPPTNASAHHSSFRKTSNTVYTLASIGGLFSYTLLLISLMLMRRRRNHNKAIGPSDILHDDLSNKQIKLIFLSQVILTMLFLSAVGLFYYLVRNQPKDGWYYYLMILGVAAQFIAQWAAIVGCHVFAISSLALGTLSDDTIRRIQQMEVINPQQSRQNDASTGTTETQEEEEGEGATSDGTEPRQADPETVTAERNGRRSENTGGQTTESNAERIDVVTPSVRDYGATTANVGQNSNQNQFDIAIRYHEELCAIVSDTVSAYCPWFVMHWFFYGATCLIGVIYISEEFTYSKNPFKLAYVSVFLVTHIYMFLFPCCCAAYITDTCGGIYSRINKTTSDYWRNEGHPFKERAQLMMFTAYAKDRQCVFKIGRLTFTSTLAWISLLLGSTGLLFHFF